MGKVYKVWVQIEMIDEDNDVLENIGEPEDFGLEFDKLEGAQEFVGLLEALS